MQKDADKDSEVRAYHAASAKHNYLIELIIHGKSCVCLNSELCRIASNLLGPVLPASHLSDAA